MNTSPLALTPYTNDFSLKLQNKSRDFIASTQIENLLSVFVFVSRLFVSNYFSLKIVVKLKYHWIIEHTFYKHIHTISMKSMTTTLKSNWVSQTVDCWPKDDIIETINAFLIVFILNGKCVVCAAAIESLVNVIRNWLVSLFVSHFVYSNCYEVIEFECERNSRLKVRAPRSNYTLKLRVHPKRWQPVAKYMAYDYENTCPKMKTTLTLHWHCARCQQMLLLPYLVETKDNTKQNREEKNVYSIAWDAWSAFNSNTNTNTGMEDALFVFNRGGAGTGTHTPNPTATLSLISTHGLSSICRLQSKPISWQCECEHTSVMEI